MPVNSIDPDRGPGQTPPAIAIRSLWILAVAVAGVLLGTRLVQVSMFFDGGIYATVARNLAEGRGSAWRLHFTETLFPLFSEHPPLLMWLQAAAFLVFGDSIAVEKGVSLALFGLACALLYGIWARVHADDAPMRRVFPFVLVLLLVSGRFAYGFANGLLENLLTVLSLAAVLATLAAREPSPRDRPARRVALMAAAGLAVFLALLTKGPVGLFPLATPALHWLVLRRSGFGSVVTDTLVMVSVVALCVGGLLYVEPAREAIGRYVDAQLLSSLSGARGHYGGGLRVLRKLVGINGYAILIVALLALAGWRLRGRDPAPGARPSRGRRAAFLLAVALSASLPIGLSPRVSNAYFNPSLCFYASALAVAGAPFLLALLARLGPRPLRALHLGALLALAASIAAVGAAFGRPGPDARTIAQADAIGQAACPDPSRCTRTIAACDRVWEDWALHTYLQRRHRMNLGKAAEVDTPLLLANETCRAAPGYTDTGVDVSPYVLLRRASGG